MKTIEFDAKFGDIIKRVKLIFNDKGGHGYQVLIGNFYQGEIFYIDGMWRVHLNDRSILTSDDIGILGEIIETGLK